jgi:uncharacterized protein YecT (DUF1311 family)
MRPKILASVFSVSVWDSQRAWIAFRESSFVVEALIATQPSRGSYRWG